MKLRNFGKGLNHLIYPTLLRDPANVIDAGSSYGEFVDAWKKMFPDLRTNIVCLEPSRHARGVFSKTHSGPGIYLFDNALTGETPGEVEFVEYLGSKGKYHQWGNCEALYGNKVPAQIKRNRYSVSTTNLSCIMNSPACVGCIDYLKMDIEGSEHSVIMNLDRETSDRITQMSFELHRPGDREEILKKLKRLGFGTIIEEGMEVYATK